MDIHSSTSSYSDSSDSSLSCLKNYDPSEINQDLLDKCPFLAKKPSFSDSESSYDDEYYSYSYSDDDTSISQEDQKPQEDKAVSSPPPATNYKEEGLKLVILLYHLLQSDAVDITKIDDALRKQLDTVVGVNIMKLLEENKKKRQAQKSGLQPQQEKKESAPLKQERTSQSFLKPSSTCVNETQIAPSSVPKPIMGEHDQTRLDSDQKGTSLNPLSESCPSFMNYSSVSPLSNYNPYNKQTVVHSTHFSNTNNDNIENDDLYITTNPLPSSMNMSDDFDKVPVLKFPSFSSPSPIHDEDFLSQDSFSDFSYLSDSNDEEYYNYKERDSHPHLLNACLPAPVDSIHDSKDVHCDTDVLSQQSFSDVSDSSLLSLLNSTKSPSDLSPKKKLSCPSSNEKLNSTSTHVEPDVLSLEEEHDSVPLQKVATTTSPLSTDRYKPRNRSSCPHSLTDHKNKTRYSFEDTTDSTAFINRKNYGKEEIVHSLYNNNVPTVDFFLLPVVYTPRETGLLGLQQLHLPPNTYIADKYLVVRGLGKAAFSLALECIDMKNAQKKHVCLKIIKHRNSFFDQSLDEIRMLRYLNSKGDPDKTRTLQLLDYFYFQEHLVIVTELLHYNLYKLTRVVNTYGLEQYFTLGRIQKIAKQCLIALEFIHKSGIIHCDLKPENILIENYEQCKIKIVDFGGSNFTTSSTLSSYIQSRAYRAPEVILGLPYDNRIDMWSLGCILCELYNGRVLFENHSIQSLLRQIIFLLGNPPFYLLQLSKNAKHYFTPNNTLYETHKDTVYEYVRPLNALPPRTSLMSRLNCTNELFIDFLFTLLTWDPNKRSTASQALQHPFITQTIEVPDYDATPIYDIQKRHHRLNRHQYAMNSNEPYSYSVKSASRTPPHTHSNLNGSRSSANSNSGKKNENVYFNNNKKSDTNVPCSISSPFSSSECYTDTGDDD